MPAVFYVANTTARAEEMALDALREGKHAVIVPDRFTLSVEREIFAHIGKRATFDIDVLSFSRLAIRMTDQALPCLSKEGAVMVLKRVLRVNRDKLCHYGGAALRPGFANELYAAIASFRVMGTTPDDLLETAGTAGGASANKLRDLALLMREYESAAAMGHTDTLLRYDRAIACARECSYLKGRHITVAGFDFFTGKQLKFLTALMEAAPSFRAALCPTNHGANAEVYPMGTFSALKAAAETRGIPYEVVTDEVQLPQPFAFINRNLFSYPRERGEGGGKVHLYRESNDHELYQATARLIRCLVDTRGYRFRDVAVLSPVPEHNLALQDVFTRYGIPLYFDAGRTLQDSAVAQLVAGLSECSTYHCRADKMRVLAHNPIWGFSQREGDAFDAEAVRAGVRFDAFDLPWEGCEQGERVRKRLTDAVRALPQGVASLARHVAAVKEVLSPLKQRPDLFADAPDGEFQQAAWEHLDGVLDEMVSLIGEEPMDGAAFRDQLAASAAAETVSAIPSQLDVVFVGDLGESRFRQIRALFVVDAVAGAFPRDFGYQSVLSALDIELLGAHGVGVYPTPMQQVVETQFRILDLFTKTETLYLGVADADPCGVQQSVGSVFEELKRMLQLPVRRVNEEFLQAATRTPEGLRRYLVTTQNARFEWPLLQAGARGQAGKAVASSIRAALAPAAEQPAPSSVNGARLLGDTTAVSQLECYFRCPYQHLLRYGLRLKRREDGAFRPTDVGTLFHAVLERFFRAYVATGGQDVPPPAKVAAEVVDEERARYRTLSPMQRYTLDAVERQAREVLITLERRARQSGYVPALIEAQFGMGEGELPGLRVEGEGQAVTLRGKIDRVDVRAGTNGCVVIDYKVGQSEHGALSDVFYGTQIQLFVYLNALKQIGYRPEGAFYLPIRLSYRKGKVGDALPLCGQVLDDAAVLDALDPTLAGQLAESGRAESETMQLSACVGGKGVQYKGNDVLDAGRLDGILDYVLQLVGQAVKEIRQGYAAKSTLGASRCAYCDYLPLCGGAQETRRTAQSETPALFGGSKG